MTKYTTVSGDEWDGICYKVYGEGGEKHMDKVIRANPRHMHTAVFSAGIVLTIPAINVVQEFENKPPWKR